jgi:tetratricopeptide (TPR) repeat protein
MKISFSPMSKRTSRWAIGGASGLPRRLWPLALLGVVATIAYLPLYRAGFIWDDDSMLTANPLIRSSDGLYQFWLTRHAVDYWPVTYSTLWLEWRLWGLHPLGYHLTNLALHVTEAVLLAVVLRRLRAPGAWLAALIFAVHPVNVESVAWIAQRKNLMAMLFYLLAILWFLKAEDTVAAVDSGTEPLPRLRRWYWLSLIAFSLAMLSKGSVATLPLVLAGIICWRRRLNASDLRRLAPFFVIAAALAAVDIWFQSRDTAEAIRTVAWPERLMGAGGIIWFYLGKALWPARLIFVYPSWRIQAANPLWWMPFLGVLGFTALLWTLARKERNSPGPPWARAGLFAWGYFCVSLLPVLGFTDVYFMKFSLVADHYAHVALIGVVAWMGFTVASFWPRTSAGTRVALSVLVSLGVVSLSALTWRQNRMYRDAETLYRTILEQNPAAWMVHSNLGLLLAAKPNPGPAPRAEFEAALRLKPDYAEAHNNLGLEWEKIPGRQGDALAEFREALRLKPRYALAHKNLADWLMKIGGHFPEAAFHYEEALRQGPDEAETEENLAVALAQLPDRQDDALVHYEAALRLRPDFADAHDNLAIQLAKIPGRWPEAVFHYEAALRINPNDAAVHNNLAVVLGKIPGRETDAIRHFETAIQLDPNDADTHYNFANQLMREPALLARAITQYELAVRLRPGFAAAHFGLGVADGRVGRLDDAIREFKRVLALEPENTRARAMLERLSEPPR